MKTLQLICLTSALCLPVAHATAAANLEIQDSHLNTERLGNGCAYTDNGILFADDIGSSSVIYEYSPDASMSSEECIRWVCIFDTQVSILDISGSDLFASFDGVKYDIVDPATGNVLCSILLTDLHVRICNVSGTFYFIVFDAETYFGNERHVSAVYRIRPDGSRENVFSNLARPGEIIKDIECNDSDLFALCTNRIIKWDFGASLNSYQFPSSESLTQAGSLHIFGRRFFVRRRNTVSEINLLESMAAVTAERQFPSAIMGLYPIGGSVYIEFFIDYLAIGLLDWETGNCIVEKGTYFSFFQLGNTLYGVHPYSLLTEKCRDSS